jgi:opacity protein-like surface antigen
MKNFNPKPAFLFFVFLFSFRISFASDTWFSTGARSFALGNIRAVGDEWLNPAAVSFVDGKQIGLSALDRFRMSELTTGELSFAYPNRRLDAGFRLTTFGYSDYRLTQLQGNFAKKIRPNCSLGLQINYRSVHSRWEESSKDGFSAGLGLYYRLNEQVDLALLGEHLLRFSEQETERWQAGLQYRMSTALVLFIETAYDRKTRFRFSAGADYAFSESLHIRSGYDSDRGMPAFGAGYAWNRWQVDTGFALHSVLGVSSMIGVKYAF